MQLDELRNEVFKAEKAVEKFVESNKQYLMESIKEQYNLPNDTEVTIYCINGYTIASFKQDNRSHNVHFNNGCWHEL